MSRAGQLSLAKAFHLQVTSMSVPTTGGSAAALSEAAVSFVWPARPLLLEHCVR